MSLIVSLYLDDILIFLLTPEEHIEHVRIVLQKIKDQVGHIISADGIKPIHKNYHVSTIGQHQKMSRRSFLGFANYFRRYIHDFTKHVVPLFNLTKGNNSRSQGALAGAKTLKIRDLNVPLKLSPMHQTLHWVLS